jgi:hypothetical protein
LAKTQVISNGAHNHIDTIWLLGRLDCRGHFVFFMMRLSMVGMGSGINLFSIFLLAPLVIMSALSIGLVLGAVAGFWIFAELSRRKKAEGKISG